MPLVGFEPTISAGKWPKTYTLDRAATGTSTHSIYLTKLLLLTNHSLPLVQEEFYMSVLSSNDAQML
jgi:hypothetical protein